MFILLAVGLSLNSFNYVEICSLYIHFGKSFYHEWMLNFIKCFFCIYWDDHAVFVFCWCGVSHWFAYVLSSLWTWNESNMVMVYDFFMCCWIRFVNILLRIFASIFVKDLPVIFFFGGIFVWFWYQSDGGLQNELGSDPSSRFFGIVSEG